MLTWHIPFYKPQLLHHIGDRQSQCMCHSHMCMSLTSLRHYYSALRFVYSIHVSLYIFFSVYLKLCSGSNPIVYYRIQSQVELIFFTAKKEKKEKDSSQTTLLSCCVAFGDLPKLYLAQRKLMRNMHEIQSTLCVLQRVTSAKVNLAPFVTL